MATPLREKLSDAIRFWEIRRIFYNGWLAAIILFRFFINWPYSREWHGAETPLIALLAMFLLANLVYCAAYPVDIVVQMTGAREKWRSFRRIFFLFGMFGAGVLINVWANSMFPKIVA